MNKEDKLLDVYRMLSGYDMVAGYWYLYPAYNVVQLREGVCAQIKATNLQQYWQLCSIIVPKLLEYKAPLVVMNPLRCYGDPKDGFCAITIFTGDWDARGFFKELVMGNDFSYSMQFSRYVDYNKIVQSNLVQTANDYLSCIYC